MIPLLSTVLSQARSHLNDDEAVNWTDQKLIPKAQQAFNHLQAELLVAGIPIINSESAIITVPAMTIDDDTVDLSTIMGYPTDMIMPIWMKERQVGDMNIDFVDMLEVDFIPPSTIQTQLLYWSWYQQTIILRGALTANQVQLRYQRLLAMPQTNTDNTQVILSELYLSFKTAGLAALSIRDTSLYGTLDGVAERNLYKIIQMNVKQLQDLPTKRRPYHRGPGKNLARSF